MQYQVRALGADGVIAESVVVAADEADARRQLEARGLVVSAITRSDAAWWRRAKRGDSALPLVLFSQELLALLIAGLSVVEALEALAEKESSPDTAAALGRLLSGLREGKRFSAVLAEQPQRFPPLYVGIVKASEGTSDLPQSLERFIAYQQRIDAIRGKLVSAAIYPSILLSVGAGVSFFLMSYVVPKFAEVYQGAGRSLPWMSQLLLTWGQFATQNAVALLLLAATLVLGLVWLAHSARLRDGALELVQRLPAIGERIRIYELSRLYLTLGMLTEGGIPLVQAMTTVRDVLAPSTQAALQRAQDQVDAGLPLSVAFETQGLTTPISLRLLRVGERTGAMGDMLSKSAAFYDGEINRWVDRFSRSFEPLLMAAIGLVVGAIVVLLYMPIFDLAGDIG